MTKNHLITLLALLLAAAACTPGGGSTTTTGSSETTTTASTGGGDDDDGEATTVTVGFISPTTGFVAALGTDMQRGWDMYWNEHGNTVGNITVETVYEDDAGDPEIALTKARRLVEEVDVDILAGPILANTALAVAEYAGSQQVPTLHITAADDITQRQFNDYVLRVGYSGSQTNFPAGQWAYEQGYRNAITLCPDYAFGWESCAGFVSAFVAAGGEVTEQIWHPLGTQDFSSYITQIQSASPDVVFIGSAGGADAIQLWSSWTDFGLDFPIIGNCCFADQVFLREVGDETIGSIQSFSNWVEGNDIPSVQTFVAAYEAEYGEIPSLYSAGSYMMAMVVAETLAITGGAEDGAAFIEAASGLSMEDSLYGPGSFDEFNNFVGPVYQTDVVEREDGVLWAVVGETFENVSQFWTFDPDEFLARPSFSTENQGLD